MKKKFLPLQFWSTCCGNFFEHFDTGLFGFLSPFLAPLFFPTHDPLTALILTYAMIPLCMLARPFGSLFFGYIGDVYGRRDALFLTLFCMGALSLCIAISPTYQSIGVLAPLLFCFWRFGQNFFAAGEVMGGAIFLLETIETDKKDLMSSLYSASTVGGILLASFGVYGISFLNMTENGWRILYVFGAITALFGCLLRINIPKETPIKTPSFSIKKIISMIWEQKKNLFLLSIIAGFFYANFSVSMVLINGFIPLVTSFTKSQMSQLNTFLLVLDFATLPLFGYLAMKISREKLMMGAALCILVSAIPLFSLLKYATLPGVIFIRITFVILGVAFAAPFHAYAQNVVPKSHRYLIISLSYALGSQLLGGPAAMISLWTFKQTHLISSVAWYWIILAFAALLSLISIQIKQTQLKKAS